VNGSGTSRLLIAGRLVVGGAALVAPRTAGRVFGLRPEDNPGSPYLARLFGVRAVGMALMVATSVDAERARQVRAGMYVDAVDALAAAVSGVRGELPPRAALLGCAAALPELGLGLATISSTSTPVSVPVHRTADSDPGPRAHDQNRAGV